MAGSIYAEWLNRNARRAFPFAEDSNMACTDGVVVPDSLVLDARLCAFGSSADGATRDVLLESIEVFQGGYILVFSSPGAMSIEVESTGGQGKTLLVAGVSGDTSYRFYLGCPEEGSLPHGLHRLAHPPKILRSRVLSIPYGVGVSDITCGEVSATGEIRVADGVNSTLNINGAGDLVLDVARGIGKGAACPDLPSDPGTGVKCGNPLYYINGQGADSDGGFQLLGGPGISVTTETRNGKDAIVVKTTSAVNNFLYKN